jgi:hypothetical protein
MGISPAGAAAPPSPDRRSAPWTHAALTRNRTHAHARARTRNRTHARARVRTQARTHELSRARARAYKRPPRLPSEARTGRGPGPGIRLQWTGRWTRLVTERWGERASYRERWGAEGRGWEGGRDGGAVLNQENLPCQCMMTDVLYDVPGSLATTVAAGYAHTCAVLVKGGVMCWGSNENGQIGTGSFGNYFTVSVPVKFSGNKLCNAF